MTLQQSPNLLAREVSPFRIMQKKVMTDTFKATGIVARYLVMDQIQIMAGPTRMIRVRSLTLRSLWDQVGEIT